MTKIKLTATKASMSTKKDGGTNVTVTTDAVTSLPKRKHLTCRQ